MRIIASGDYHLSLREPYGIMRAEGINTRLQDKLDAISQIVDYAVKNKADLFITVGDEMDQLNPPEILRYKFIEVMSPLFHAGIPWRLIMGNHTYNNIYYNFQGEEKLLTLIGQTDFKIISEPTIEDFKGEPLKDTRDSKGIPLSYLPWCYIKDAETFLKANPNRIVFGHLPIKGALLNDYEVRSKEGLNNISNQRFIFMGHYHKYQSSNNWCYVGSPIRCDFSERNQEKGFLDIQVETNGLDYTFIEIKDRDFLQLEFSEPSDPMEYINNMTDIDGAIVKVKLSGTNPWIYSVNKTEVVKTLELKKALKVLSPEIEVLENKKKKFTMSKDSTFSDNIHTYCKEKKRLEVEDQMQEMLSDTVNNMKDL